MASKRVLGRRLPKNGVAKNGLSEDARHLLHSLCRRGLSQREIARRLRVPQYQISRMQAGKSHETPRMKAAVRRARERARRAFVLLPPDGVDLITLEMIRAQMRSLIEAVDMLRGILGM